MIDGQILWRQFGVAIDSFGDALRDCPDELWEARLWDDEPEQFVARGFGTFWYLGYHTLFWLDLYLSGVEEEQFAPPDPFDMVEMRPNEALPRVYSKAELISYTAFCREKCRETLTALTNEEARRMCRYPWGEVTYLELVLYNMRHVVEHAAQLHLFLGQQAGKPGG